MKIRSMIITLASAVMLTACATAPVATTPPQVSTEVKTLLWVGNSFFYYNNSMHGHVGQLLSAAGVKGTRGTSATISGSGINWHDVEAHFKPGGVASYSFVGDNEVRFNSFEKPFDGVMMMDCSQCPIHPKLQSIFYEYAAKHSATARKYGAAPILFMSWAYQDKPEMTAQLAAEYVKAGKQNNALVVPASHVTGVIAIIATMLRVGGAVVMMREFKAAAWIAEAVLFVMPSGCAPAPWPLPVACETSAGEPDNAPAARSVSL